MERKLLVKEAVELIKSRSEWSFTEWQSHAAGFLEGIVFGIAISINVGCIVWVLLR